MDKQEAIQEIQNFFDQKADCWDQMNHYNFDIIKQVLPKLQLDNASCCLDVGCGTGVITQLLLEQGCKEVVGIDLSSKMINQASKKISNPSITFLHEDYYHFLHSGIDRIIVYSAYPHFKDKAMFAYKAYELLEDNGLLMILHSSSKESINHCHGKFNRTISNKLLPVSKELENFTKYFTVIDTIDDDEKYYMVLKKKSA